MQYRKFGNTGFEISALGFGAMRLPVADVPLDGPEPDLEPAVDLLCRGFEAGINYVDTAYFYLRGWSEIAVGRALKRNHWRDRVRLSTKLPLGELKCADDFWRILENQLRKLDTDHIDFYHFHGIGESALSGPIREFRLFEQAAKARDRGMIRHLSFSFHDRLGLFKEVVESAPWDFCLIQHNYLDYEYEAGCLGPKYAAANGMGLAVMKPVRTGFLANLPPAMREALRSTGVVKPDVEWALDYLWDIPEVSVAVSGMGSMADVEANLRYASKAKPNMLTPDERKALGAATRAFRQAPGHIDCTGCYQCIPCPHNVAIGYIFAYVYNNYLLHKNKKKALFDYTVSMSPIQRGAPASACVNCGACLAKCPQKLNIPELLKRVRNDLEA